MKQILQNLSSGDTSLVDVPCPKNLKSNILNKVVMVTGAGGSIGSELARQIIKLNPIKIILLY